MKFFCWQKIQTLPWTNSVSKFPGVYAIYDHSNELVYIGSSMNLRRRISRYAARYNPDWSLKVRYTKFVGEWAFREIRLIRRLKPLLNTQNFEKVRI
jgi:excinuclease UvrABC nuclease subunit